MMDRRSLLAAMAALPFAGAARADTLEAGRLVEYPDMASAHAATRNVTVWLPPGYDAGVDRHPVLYMHDARTCSTPPARRSANGAWTSI